MKRRIVPIKKETLGEHIHDRRKRSGYEFEGDLAIAVGVTQQTVSAWEADKSVPSAPNLRKLADALDEPVETLMDLMPEDSPRTPETISARMDRFEATLDDLANRIEKIMQSDPDSRR